MTSMLTDLPYSCLSYNTNYSRVAFLRFKMMPTSDAGLLFAPLRPFVLCYSDT